MDQTMQSLHLTAGRLCGVEATCGKKIDYKSEETAGKAASAMMRKGSKALEPYPCVFCEGWHIGRQMSREELESYIEQGSGKTGP